MKDEDYKKAILSGNGILIKRAEIDILGKIEVPITAHIVKGGGTVEDAKTTMYEAFMILKKRVLKGKSFDGSIVKYIFGICRNLWKEELRLRKGKIQMSSNLEFNYEKLNKKAENTYWEEIENYNQMIINEELSKIIQVEIKLLNSNYQEIFNLFHFDNLSYQEISQLLDIDERNARKRLSRATRKLKNQLKEKYPNKFDFFFRRK